MLIIIDTEEQYHNALSRAYDLMQMDFEERSALYNELDALAICIEKYELVHHPIKIAYL